MKGEVKYSVVTPQTKTNARILAEGDPRNVLTMAIMMKCFCEHMNPKLLFNWDATQYEVNHDKNMKTIVILNEIDDIPPTIKSSGSLSFFVKHYHLHNALGYVAPPVYVIANDALQPEDLVARQVTDIGFNGGTAWLCFTKTRGGNAAFFDFYFNSVVIPFVVQVRNVRNLSGVSGEVPHAFVYCDGEASQIAVIQKPENLSLLKSLNILIGKSPASCSGILQASDVADTFKAIKKRLKRGEGVIDFTEDVNEDIMTILNEMGGFTAEKKAIIIDALEYISFSVVNCARRDTVSAGYKRTGQFPVDFNKTMSLTTYRFKPAEINAVIEAVPHLVEHMRKYGELTEALMDKHNIPNLNSLRWSSKDNDTRPLSNQRAVIMNSETCIKKHIERMKLRELVKAVADNTAPKKRGRKPKVATANATETTETPTTATAKPKRAYNKRKIEPVALPDPKEPRLEDNTANVDKNTENMKFVDKDKDDTSNTSNFLTVCKNIFGFK